MQKCGVFNRTSGRNKIRLLARRDNSNPKLISNANISCNFFKTSFHLQYLTKKMSAKKFLDVYLISDLSNVCIDYLCSICYSQGDFMIKNRNNFHYQEHFYNCRTCNEIWLMGDRSPCQICDTNLPYWERSYTRQFRAADEGEQRVLVRTCQGCNSTTYAR